MRLRRSLAAAFVLLCCLTASWSGGLGTASADRFTNILRAADEVVAVITSKFPNLSPARVRSQFVAQVDTLTPVTDEVALFKVKSAWSKYEPRTPRQNEVVAKRGTTHGPYEMATGMLCQTAAELLVTDEKDAWQFAVSQVQGTILQQHPLGARLAFYKELTEITQKFLCGEYCAGTAKLAVLLATEAYC